MVKVSCDENFTFGMFGAADVSVHQREFAGTERGIDLAMYSHRALLHQGFQHVILIAGYLEAAAGFVELFSVWPDSVVANHIRMIGPVAGCGINHNADSAVL